MTNGSESGGKRRPSRRSRRSGRGGNKNQNKNKQNNSNSQKKTGNQGNQGGQGGGNRRRPSGNRGSRGRRRRGGQNNQPPRQVVGFMEKTRNGAGVLRQNGTARDNDAMVPVSQVNKHGLRPGDLIEGLARGRSVYEIKTVNGHALAELPIRVEFDRLTAVHPEVPIVLGPVPEAITGRLIDIIAPVGRGQRGLIVAPPKAGKTTLLKEIAAGVSRNPGLELIVCLVGERPEEVTEIRRVVDGVLLAADLDAPAVEHTRVADLGVEYAKRLVEEGRHAVVLIDSLTRLARAHNLSTRGGGRTLSGGMEASALQPVRKVFGAARATEEAGSLTILATCLVDTGSKMDDVVYEEFKGTGNMEVHLDRKLAQRRLFPAIDINRSGTRREELLLDSRTLQQVTSLRRKLAGVPPDKALSALLAALKRQTAETESILG